MSYKICVYIDEIENINRTVIVDSNIPLDLFVKCAVLSMNGKSNKLCCFEDDEDYIEIAKNSKLSDMAINVGNIYTIIYDYTDRAWNLNFEILEINDNNSDKIFEIIDGNGHGILDGEDWFYISNLLLIEDSNLKARMLQDKKIRSYYDYEFSLDTINKTVSDYIEFYNNHNCPKNYIMNVSLEGFNREIKRQIVVNNNMLIDQFCRCVTATMNGDMEHLYTVKIDKYTYDEEILNEQLTFLDLSVGSKFKVIYDYGDNWQFNIKISKVIEEFNEKPFTVLKGKGYGIVEDCGGIYGLSCVFEGEHDFFEDQDINEFDLDTIQKNVDKQLKIKNLYELRQQYYR